MTDVRMEEIVIRINKKSLVTFLFGFVVAAPIFIGGTYLFTRDSGVGENFKPSEIQAGNTIEPVFNFDDANIVGDKNAKVTVVVYSDFECPYCANHHETIKQIIAKYGNKVRVVWKNFPLSFHANAEPAANAAECAGEQGKFWEYADKLYANQENFGATLWAKLAGELKLNTSKFNSCVSAKTYQSKIDADLNEGIDNAVEGTPATFINGELISGALPLANFVQIIDEILK
jgi:protein-disulfide isomerase